MIILRPDFDILNLKVIPRFYYDGEATIYVKKGESEVIWVKTVYCIDGYMYMSFRVDIVYQEGDSLTIRIETRGELTPRVIYRGKIFVTDQVDLQNYKTTDDTYI